MSAHVLLNLFKELGKRGQMRGLSTLFTTSIINSYNRSMNIRFYLSYDPKIIYFKITFHGMKNIKILVKPVRQLVFEIYNIYYTVLGRKIDAEKSSV